MPSSRIKSIETIDIAHVVMIGAGIGDYVPGFLKEAHAKGMAGYDPVNPNVRKLNATLRESHQLLGTPFRELPAVPPDPIVGSINYARNFLAHRVI